MDQIATLLAILTPLFAVPLTVILFFLRSMREHQQTWQNEWTRIVRNMESRLRACHEQVEYAQRDFVKKEEWLRECMYARNHIQRILEAAGRPKTPQQPPRPHEMTEGEHPLAQTDPEKDE